ncbi:cache domain-containing sensor histidine kinase [Saliterribacillus persicus]|uniref:histidine kinase n=1 Tax=Saliterribacillus persicus TaxID=930114 RepID=A0A368XYY1_9BACI|nr:sensor histidine kinase [Saliterribacillus persicus]RCW73193.1 HAMP domain-containing protein [Saliterribacillus persicus]
MHRFRAASIRTKMFVIFASAYIIVISLVGFIMYVSNVNEMKDQAQSLSKVLSTQFSRTIDLYFNDIERLSTGIFTDNTVQENLGNYDQTNSLFQDINIRNNLYPHLFSQAYPRRDIERVIMYTNSGTSFIYDKRGDMEISYEKETAKWSESLYDIPKHEFLILPTTEIELLSGEKAQVVSLVRHIYTIPQREKIGSMKIDINVNVFDRLLELENVEELEEYLKVIVLGPNKSVIYDQQRQYTGASDIGLDVSISKEEEPLDGTLSWQDKQYLYANRHSEYTSWDTAVLIDNEFIIYERNQIILFIAVTGAAAVAIIAIISYFLSHQIAKPLMNMIERMKRVERGDLHDRMELTGNSDMDLFTRVYNNMLDSINKLISEVYESSITEKNAKIAALQSQINPHFLYNTLNTMKSISRIRGVEEVAEISESLADLFKYSMKDLDKLVPLKEELKHIENYMNIQQHRFQDRFVLKSEIDTNIEHSFIPKLIIQPLIENAINHGLADVKSGGIVHLKIRKKDNNLMVYVQDNGAGMTKEKLEEINSSISKKNTTLDPKEGVGLNNVIQRIRLIYGHRYGVNIESYKDEGTTVILNLPYKEEQFTPREGTE